MADQGEEVKKESKKRKILLVIIILLASLLLLAAGGTFAFFFFGDSPGTNGSPADEPEPDHYFKLEDILVNLADDHQRRFLKTSLVLAYHEEEMAEELEMREAKLRDRIIDVLRKKNVEDIQEEGSTDKIRNEIIVEVNELLSGGIIEEVYFTEFIIQ